MNNFPSPFAGIISPNVVSNTDTSISLLDLISSHSSLNQDGAENEESALCNLTSKFLKVDNSQSIEDNLSTLPSCLGNLIITGKTVDDESDACNSLEAYTKSFLNSRGTVASPLRKPAPPPNFTRHISKVLNSIESVKPIEENLQNIGIDENHKAETRKIDLTAALWSKSKTDTLTLPNEIPIELKHSVFTYPVKECYIDLSSLANENLLYSNTSLSPLGCVISKQWKRIIFPKKYRKLERTRPYNIAKSFKFDCPSPDDCPIRRGTRNTSMSET